jgi:CheY-like chemotaxis protein
VFERFWQEDSRINRRFMGLGLGLAIVRHVVELHGGTVTASSRGEGRGATFTVRIPTDQKISEVPEPRLAPIREARTQNQASASEARLENLKVLLIDDSIDSLELLSRLLKKKGAQVTAVSQPHEGLLQAKSSKFDIVVSDIGMPDLSGYDLMKQLRNWEEQERRPHVPSVALTAYASTADAEQAIAAGFQRHLPKPINFTALAQALTDLMESRGTDSFHEPKA